MFLSRRATQAEYFDLPDLSESEVADSYAALAGINRIFVFAEPFQRALPRLLGNERCRALSVLDLGAGDGSLGAVLAKWAGKRGWTWRFTNVDLRLSALDLGRNGHNVTASALALPFHNDSFDVVIASQMTHHLTTDEQVRQHLREAWRVAREGVVVSDLHRNAALYAILWLVLTARRDPKSFRDDGLLSVRRAFRVHELQAHAEAAGMANARVTLYFGARVLLQARKSVNAKSRPWQ